MRQGFGAFIRAPQHTASGDQPQRQTQGARQHSIENTRLQSQSVAQRQVAEIGAAGCAQRQQYKGQQLQINTGFVKKATAALRTVQVGPYGTHRFIKMIFQLFIIRAGATVGEQTVHKYCQIGILPHIAMTFGEHKVSLALSVVNRNMIALRQVHQQGQHHLIGGLALVPQTHLCAVQSFRRIKLHRGRIALIPAELQKQYQHDQRCQRRQNGDHSNGQVILGIIELKIPLRQDQAQGQPLTRCQRLRDRTADGTVLHGVGYILGSGGAVAAGAQAQLGRVKILRHSHRELHPADIGVPPGAHQIIIQLVGVLYRVQPQVVVVANGIGVGAGDGLILAAQAQHILVVADLMAAFVRTGIHMTDPGSDHGGRAVRTGQLVAQGQVAINAVACFIKIHLIGLRYRQHIVLTDHHLHLAVGDHIGLLGIPG